MSYEPHEVCNCTCHSTEGVYHVMACCHQCPHCGANIKRGFETEHGQRCEQEHLDAGLPVNQYVLDALNLIQEDILRYPRTVSEQVMDDIDQVVLAEMREVIEKAERENSPAVQFLRQCQERERKLK